MTDRELLELAAKAAKYETDLSYEYDEDWGLKIVGLKEWWNPLTDDGDCARLEAQLDISVTWEKYQVKSFTPIHTFTASASFSNYEQDKNKARRWVSVMCAAEIGKTK